MNLWTSESGLHALSTKAEKERFVEHSAAALEAIARAALNLAAILKAEPEAMLSHARASREAGMGGSKVAVEAKYYDKAPAQPLVSLTLKIMARQKTEASFYWQSGTVLPLPEKLR